jgi:hypothetical protein
MKAALLTLLLILQLLGRGMAATALVPEVPPHKLTATGALAIAEKQLGKDAGRFTLVGLEWFKSSEFKPRYFDGTQYTAGDDHPDDYCWFVTYLYKREAGPGASGSGRKFDEVLVIRIKDDGTIGRFIGART